MGAYAPSIQHCFQSSDGADNGVEMFNPVIKWRIPTNWKFPGFSFAGYAAHGAMTHRSINVAAIGLQGAMEGGSRSPMRAPFPSTLYSVGDHDLGHGGQNTIYDQTGARPYQDTWQTIPEVDEYYRKISEEKQKRYEGKYLPAGGHGGGHFCIFPNIILDHWRILYWHPHGVGVTESWRLYPRWTGRPQGGEGRPAQVCDALLRPDRHD